MGLISYIKNTFVGKKGELLATVRRYKNDDLTARIYNPAGIDARPIDDDVCFSERSEDTEGGRDVIGFVTTQVSAKGEVRVFSRDSGGNIKAFFHIKNDSEIEIVSGPQSIVIKITPDGKFTATTLAGMGDLIVDNVSHKHHIHIDSWGLPTGEPLEIGESIPSPPTEVELQSDIDTVTNLKKIDGKTFLSHQHSNVTNGPNNSGGVV